MTCAFAVLDEVWSAFNRSDAAWAAILDTSFLAVLALSIAMLGPGAWSVDARLFGRKRFDLDRIRGRKRSL